MSSSSMILLFTEPRPTPRDPYSIMLSGLAHIGMGGLISFGLMYTPHVIEPPLAQRYTMRQIEINMPQPKTRPAVKAIAQTAQPSPSTLKAPNAGAKDASKAAAKPEIAQEQPAKQTIIQPKLPPKLTLPEEVPLPSVMLWSSKDEMDKWIIPPKPLENLAANDKPSLTPPNQEVKMADLQISSTQFETQKLSLMPATSSPVVVRGPSADGHTPETASISSSQPTGAQVISLSDMVMPQGMVMLPRANQSAKGDSSGALGAGSEKTNAPQGNRGNGGSSQAGDSAVGNGAQGAVTHYSFPKTGKFAIVVVGASLEEQYPETAGMWSGRMSYTVYMHVGQSKNWILQYSLPRSADAAAAGTIQVAAPYPTEEVVPNLPPGSINADALMVHGFINEAGRFEKLTVSFPPDFAQAQFVLHALEQWQFRPAARGDKPILVEVLLIIPETY